MLCPSLKLDVICTQLLFPCVSSTQNWADGTLVWKVRLMKRRPFGGLPSRRGSQLFQPFPSSQLFLKIAVNGFTLDMSSFGSCLILRNISILMLTRRIFLTRDVLVILILIFIPNHTHSSSYWFSPELSLSYILKAHRSFSSGVPWPVMSVASMNSCFSVWEISLFLF